MSIKIGKAKPEDIYQIRSVQRETWIATYPNEKLGITRADIESRFASDNTAEGRQRMEKRKKMLNSPTSKTWVAKDGTKIVGYCAAEKSNLGNRIQALYLLPSYHGKGIGTLLIKECLAWLGSDKDIYVEVASYNNSAITFYEKFGFVRSGKEVKNPVAALPSGKTIPETEMVKRA